MVNPFHTPIVTLPTNFNVVPNKNLLKNDSSGWHRLLMKDLHNAETNGLPFQVFFVTVVLCVIVVLYVFLFVVSTVYR